MSYARDIVEGMARGLWLAAYSAYAELVRDPKNWPRAKNGEDWDGVAPETPDAANIPARELANLYTTTNHVSLDKLYGMATLANGQDEDDSDQAYSFGFYLAMMALESFEMSWWDDNERFDLHIPNFEITLDGDALTWQGDAAEPLVVNASTMTGPGWNTAREKLRSATKRNGPKVTLFDHPHGARGRSSDPTTLKYRIMTPLRHGPTPRVRKVGTHVVGAKRKKRNPADEGDLRFPHVCKHCKRSIAELKTDPGHFIDSTSLTEQCPDNGRDGHEPYGK